MLTKTLLAISIWIIPVASATSPDEDGWFTLFDGTSLDGWKSNDETPNVFSITENGELRVDGGRAHLFWVGHDGIPAAFKNFEVSMQVKTTPEANSGVFFHTEYQEDGWPGVGLEAQVNTSHKDRRKTGSVYAKQDVMDNAPSTDGEWFEYNILVDEKTVTISVDGEVVNSYTEPESPLVTEKRPLAKLGQGTFAIQGHDPNSVVFYKDIRVRNLD
ncbi:MAG: DUF1080 domain-containing protein [Verrucomicrobiota bacterium]